jgi:hypothetical protein
MFDAYTQMLEAMCLTGLIPNVIKFSGPHYPLGIRKEAARLVHYFSIKSLPRHSPPLPSPLFSCSLLTHAWLYFVG